MLGDAVRGAERALGRLWRRVTGRSPQGTAVVFSSRYRLDLPGMAHDPRRGTKILAHLAGEGLLRPGEVQHPPAASFKELCRVHDVEYLESLSGTDTLTRVVGVTLSDRDRDRVISVQRRMCGGTRLTVALALQDGGTAFNLGGGLHHAFPDRGARFCVLNDVASAVAEERHDGFEGPVLIVDCDLHDGDGTRACFADDPTVHTFSIHNASSGTDADAVENTSVELGSGVDDETFLAALQHHLPPLVERFRPHLVIYLAGTDGAVDDSLGDWNLTGDGLFRRDRLVTELVRDREEPIPLVVVLAGGYGRESWRHSARYLAWLRSGRDHEPPSSEEATLARYRRLARRFRVEELTGEGNGGSGGAADWGLTEEDVLGPLAGVGGKRRFLGFYSRHGAELALERAGLLDRLRRLGFEQPSAEFELDNPAGETVRIFGDPEHQNLLIELRARRDRRSVSGCEMLRVEWLLLQNPRARFTRERPPLPGQRYPGLGLLEDVTAMLVLICDRLGLDGLFFVPSHYHLAAQSRRFLRFLDPRDEARFRALSQALGPLALGEASRAVEAGRVVDARTGEPFELPSMPMALPLSETLEERLESDEYQRRVAEAEGEFHYELRSAAGGGR